MVAGWIATLAEECIVTTRKKSNADV